MYVHVYIFNLVVWTNSSITQCSAKINNLYLLRGNKGSSCILKTLMYGKGCLIIAQLTNNKYFVIVYKNILPDTPILTLLNGNESEALLQGCVYLKIENGLTASKFAIFINNILFSHWTKENVGTDYIVWRGRKQINLAQKQDYVYICYHWDGLWRELKTN